MIADLKRYRAMKDSNVPWLGEVPGHWEVRRLKRVCSRSALYGANVAATSYASSGVRFLRTTDITEDGRLQGAGVYLPEELIDDYVLEDGDLLISRSGTIGRSFLYDSRLHGRCSYAGYLVRFVPAFRVLPKYAFLFTKTQAFAGFLRVMAISSTIENVNGEKYANCPLPLPPLTEQATIVRFLDHADRQIRHYIRAKQKLIKLLEEQKQAIIHRAVTRGLEPNVCLKPSGVEWVGDVPEHWEVWRSKRLFKTRKELARPDDVQLSATQAYGVIPQEEYERRVGRKVVKVFRHLEKRRHVEIGDFVISMRSFQGGLERAWASGCIRSSYIVLEPSEKVDVNFFSYVFKSAGYVGALQSTANFIRDGQDLNFDNFCAVDLAVPPMQEQRLIAQRVAELIANIIATVERSRREIELLREFRTSLISDVVTGKFDVRHVAARLPEEVEDFGAHDELDMIPDIDEEHPAAVGAAIEEAKA